MDVQIFLGCRSIATLVCALLITIVGCGKDNGVNQGEGTTRTSPPLQPAAAGEMKRPVVNAANLEAFRQSLASGAEEASFRIGKAEFVLKRIPPGEFDLGSPATDKMGQPNEMPPRHVRITKAFYIGKYKVSQLQYTEVRGKHFFKFPGDSLPAEDITYSEAHQFCGALSKLAGATITLPTEAQWEYACRAGSHTRYYSGDKEADLEAVAWFEQNSGGRTHELGKKKPNQWGLYDMLGNAWEPCLDELPDFATISDTDPVGEVRQYYGMMRGGGWQYPADCCRAATRLMTDDPFGGLGIRIAINPAVANSGEK